MTLAEVLVAMALSLTTLATIQSFLTAQQKALAVQDVYSRAQSATRMAADLFARELRMAAYDPTGGALATAPGPDCPGVRRGLVQAGRERLRFRQDLDGDGKIGGGGEDVTYRRKGTTVTRREHGEQAEVVVDGVPADGFSLRYFDHENPPQELVPPGQHRVLSKKERDCVAKVRVSLRVALPKPANAGTTIPTMSVVQTEVAIRQRALGSF
jgi:hypothetical protein